MNGIIKWAQRSWLIIVGLWAVIPGFHEKVLVYLGPVFPLAIIFSSVGTLWVIARFFQISKSIRNSRPRQNTIKKARRTRLLIWYLASLTILWAVIFFREKQTHIINLPQKVFSDTSNHSFKILILPFNKQCDYNGASFDIGDVIYRRLNILNNQDTLNIVLHYLKDTLITKVSLLDFEADSIMKYHNANQIIYGFYSLKECEANDSNKICFNYRTDTSSISIVNKKFRKLDELHSFAGIDEIRKGSGQREIDYVIYNIASIAAEKSKKYSRASTLLRKIHNWQNDESILLSLGWINYSHEKWDSAAFYYEYAVKSNPDNLLTFTNLATTYMLLNRWQLALDQSVHTLSLYRDAKIKRQDVFENILTNLEAISAHFDNNVMSLYCAEKVFQTDSSDLISIRNLATSLTGAKDFEKGIYYLEKYLKLHGEIDYDIYRSLGISYFSTSQYMKAVDPLRKSIALNHNQSEVWELLAKTFYNLNQIENSAYCALVSLHLGNKTASLYTHLGKCYSDLNKIDDAMIPLYNSIKLNPLENNVWEYLANCYYVKKNYDSATICFENSISLEPTTSTEYSNAGIAYFELNNRVLAEARLKKALEIDSLNQNANFYLAKLYWFDSTDILKTKLAIKYKKRFANLNHTYEPFGMWVEIAVLYARLNDKQSMINSLYRARCIDVLRMKTLRHFLNFNKYLQDADFLKITE